MRTRALAGVLVAAGVAGGCSDRPREIREAKPVQAPVADKPVELPAGPPPAASDPKAVELIAAAVSAHTGGKPDLLDRLRSFTCTRDGTANARAGGLSMTWQIRAVWPDKFRVDAEVPGQPVMIISRTGSTAWKHILVSGVTKETVTGDQLREVLTDDTYEWLAVLTPFADKELVAVPAPERTVLGRPADGVWLTGKNLPSAVVHFDRETKRLAQFTYRGAEAGRSVVKEVIVTETEPVNGVALPRKLAIKWDGVPAVEWAVTKFDFPADIPGKVFEEP